MDETVHKLFAEAVELCLTGPPDVAARRTDGWCRRGRDCFRFLVQRAMVI